MENQLKNNEHTDEYKLKKLKNTCKEIIRQYESLLEDKEFEYTLGSASCPMCLFAGEFGSRTQDCYVCPINYLKDFILCTKQITYPRNLASAFDLPSNESIKIRLNVYKEFLIKLQRKKKYDLQDIRSIFKKIDTEHGY